ncbi:FAD-dependent oxidoreductase [Streptomyces sp. SID8366]|uniref:protoporphyrinogen/coproporphyrinogen oxidase n=1 Tax=unclassified Streptomyces TaxID=2593676 RepID=UPI000DBA27B3|nr:MULTISPECIES: FAD-dependent oxidoreductase [unclassified Streptomyces]MYU05751.1 FAD-dependent oxidoreductase [Streptomyces sp. SID8366]MYU65421.1 FAD-dependent oxidoreductase [Streptomyces sp. SID69]RAJ63800.1 oxygen-dependent protoporphyrinogen oxidase [Streptomyces sp. PsTaAH-130]
MTPELDVAVVGAGIAGLTAAHELRRAGLSVRVYEQLPDVGGRMRSLRHEGWTVDTGAEQVASHGYRATWELLSRLGVTPADVPRVGGGVAVWRGGRARPGVGERTAVLTGAGLSARARRDLAAFSAWSGRRAAGFDGDRPERTPLGATTVREATARYHRDLHDYLFQPVAGCFFGWDTARSAAAPLVGLLREAGSPSSWRTYRQGMDFLARRLAADLEVVTGRTVREVVDAGGHAVLRCADGEVRARAAVLAVPAPVAAALRPELPPGERPFLTACTFTPMLKVSCLLDRPLAPAARRPVHILLTPAAEERMLSGVVVDHAKDPGRAPDGRGLVTLVAAPRQVPDLLDADPDEAADLLVHAAERYVPGIGAARRHHFTHAFRDGLPEATPAALAERAAFLRRPVRAVEYAGDWVMLRPASEGAVRAGALAASRVLSRLGRSREAGPDRLEKSVATA